MSENDERLIKANTAAVCMRQVPHLERKVNSQDPCIINARDAITSAHKVLVANKDQGTSTLYNKKEYRYVRNVQIN